MADATPRLENDEFSFASSNKEYPLAPEGVHRVTVKRALFSMRDNKFAPEKGKQPSVSLLCQSDQTYKDEATGETRTYNLFKTMNISDNEKSNFLKFFQSALGLTEIPLTGGRFTLKRVIEKVEDGEDKVHLPQFEGMTFSVVVAHKKGDDGEMRDVIDSIFTSPEEKAANQSRFRADSESL